MIMNNLPKRLHKMHLCKYDTTPRVTPILCFTDLYNSMLIYTDLFADMLCSMLVMIYTQLQSVSSKSGASDLKKKVSLKG